MLMQRVMTNPAPRLACSACHSGALDPLAACPLRENSTRPPTSIATLVELEMTAVRSRSNLHCLWPSTLLAWQPCDMDFEVVTGFCALRCSAPIVQYSASEQQSGFLQICFQDARVRDMPTRIGTVAELPGCGSPAHVAQRLLLSGGESRMREEWWFN